MVLPIPVDLRLIHTTPLSRASRLAGGEEPTWQCRRHKRPGLDPWVGQTPWRRPWLPSPVFLPGDSHGQRSLAGYSSGGHRVRLDWTDLTRTHSSLHTTAWCHSPSLVHQRTDFVSRRFFQGRESWLIVFIFSFSCLYCFQWEIWCHLYLCFSVYNMSFFL